MKADRTRHGQSAVAGRGGGEPHRVASEHQHADAEAGRSERYFRTLIENSSDIIAIVNREGVRRYISPSVERVLGYRPEELIGRSIFELLHPEDAPEITGLFREGSERPGVTRTCAFRCRHKDGSWRFLESTGSNLLDDPEIGGIVVNSRDVTEREEAAAALRASEEKMRAVLRAIPDLMFLLSEDGVYLDYHARDTDELLVPPEDFLGRNMREVLPPELAESMFDCFRHAQESDEPQVHEYTLNIQGEERSYEARVVRSNGGSFLCMIRNITERRRAEETLRANERTFRELVDMLPIAVYVCDSSGIIESYNRRAVELWGRAPAVRDPADAFCGSYRIYTPDGTFLPHAECPMAQVLRTGVPVTNEEIVVERPDGSRRTAMVNIIPLRDEQGNLSGAINCLTDITERKQAEETLRLLNSVVRQAGEAVTITTPELDPPGPRIIFVNPAFTRMTGYAAEEVLGQTPRILHGPKTERAVLDQLREALARGEPFHAETVNYRKDGSEFHVEWDITPLRNESGEITHFVALQRDISHRKRNEEQRTHLLQRLVAAQEEERSRIARELHDQLGAYPTALLLGLKGLKESSNNTAAAEEAIAELMRLADHLGQEMHRLAWELRPMALDDLGLHNALANYVEEWSARFQIAADFHSNGLIEYRLPPQVETALYRIVQEALTNVIKHAGARRVSVIVEGRHGNVRAVIEDDGRGFDTKEMLEESPSRRRMGLVGMRERARMLGGEIEVESAPNSGTTIYVRIPVAPEDRG